jgi:hypothetical protein
MANLVRSLLRAGSTRLVKKVGKAVPLVGTAVVIGMTAYEVKKKGLLRGIVNTALDATPIIGTAKNVIEVFTGDWLADKERAPMPAAQTKRKPSAELPPI